jgi:chemotaxis protein MotB
MSTENSMQGAPAELDAAEPRLETDSAAPAEDLQAEVAPSAPAPIPMQEDEPVHECPPCKGGAPGWMATFADMATLLMAFFVLLLSFSDTELPKFEQLNGSIKAAFGVKRLVPTINIPMARSLIVEDFSPALAQRTLLDQQQQQAIDPNAEFLIRRTQENPEAAPVEEELKVVQAALADPIERGEVQVRIEDEMIVVEYSSTSSGGGAGGSGQQQASAGLISQQLLEVASVITQVQSDVTSEIQLHRLSTTTDAEELDEPAIDNLASAASGQAGDSDRFNEIRASLQGQIDRGLVEVEKAGDEVIIRLASQGSFVSGSAELDPGFMPLLAQVGSTLGAGDGRIRVEGHTDNIPVAFSPQFNSNWDLSAGRSASVAAYFSSELGIDSQRLEVSGFADTKPLESNDSASGRARNRRIEIIVE